MTTFSPKILLLDGTAMIYAAYHAMPPLYAPNGIPTGAVKGFDSTLRQLRKRFADARCIVMFDAKGKNFRHAMSNVYKANRKPMPEDLVAQISYIHKLPLLLGLPVVCMSGVEADDVIGTLATQASLQNLQTVIVTPDKDMNQLIDKNVSIYNVRKDTWVSAESVKKQYGIRIDQFIDYLTLIGDSSDNIAGVQKVGPKTATSLLQAYGSLEKVIENAHKIKGVVGKNIAASTEIVKLGKELIIIDTKLNVSLDEQKLTAVKEKELADFYQELGFTTINIEKKPTHKVAVQIIEKQKELTQTLLQLKNEPNIAIFLSIDDKNESQPLLGIGYYAGTKNSFYVPLNNTNIPLILQWITEITNNNLIHLDAKKDYRNLKCSIDENLQISDIALKSYIIDPSIKQTLEQLSHSYLDTQIASNPFDSSVSKRQQKMSILSTQELANFSALQAEAIFNLNTALNKELDKKPNLQKLLNNIEIPTLKILLAMENTGMLLNCDLLQEYSEEINQKLNELEKEIFSYSDKPFNISSPKQVSELLFDHLKLPSFTKKTGKAQSTSDEILQKIQHPVAENIRQYRSWKKLKTGYTDSLPKTVDFNSRLHTTFNQAVVITGRLSSSNPNLQNIPAKTEAGRKIRSAFIAKPNHLIVSADYSQIELRIMAHLSKDETMLNDFKNDLDIHASTASKIFEVAIDDVTRQQRNNAKAINFGLIYGTTSYGLSVQLDTNRQEAQSFIDAYFARYPSILNYMENTKKLAHQQKYTQTIGGRTIGLQNIDHKNHFIQSAAERLAINAPIQGSAADIIKLAMIAVNKWLNKSNLSAQLILQVHDELVFEVHENDLEEFKTNILPIMENVIKLTVPLVVNVGVGKNWADAH